MEEQFVIKCALTIKTKITITLQQLTILTGKIDYDWKLQYCPLD